MATTNNAINLTSQGLVGYNGTGTFSSTLVTTNCVLVGSGPESFSNVAAPANAGTPLVSNGPSVPPVFGTCEPRGGGTGLTTLVSYELMAGGTSSSNPMQQIGTGTIGQVLISNGSSALASFQSIAGTFTWTDQSSSFAALPNNGYFCTTSLTATLPIGTADGETITIYCDTGSSVVISANIGQLIRNGSSISSSGGTATSATQGNTMTIVFRSSSSTWYSTSVEGTWVLV
jgi:hypothetical protein